MSRRSAPPMPLALRRYTPARVFGSHLSIAGSMANALREAEALGLDCVQVFTKNQQQWKAPPLKPDAVREWNDERARLGWAGHDGRVVSHASYLINMASPDPALRAKSIDLMRDEIDRCHALSIARLVFHPGAFTTGTRPDGLAHIADACITLLTATRGCHVCLCLENVPGAGSTLGGPFSELADLRARILAAAPTAQDRTGFCIDTCHAHAAGYDLSTAASAKAALGALDKAVGLPSVRVLHLNDSKGKAGSHLDRHEHIGKGTIGRAGFAAFLAEPAFTSLPKIMETPKGESPSGKPWDRINVALLRRLAKPPPPHADPNPSARRSSTLRRLPRLIHPTTRSLP